MNSNCVWLSTLQLGKCWDKNTRNVEVCLADQSVQNVVTSTKQTRPIWPVFTEIVFAVYSCFWCCDTGFIEHDQHILRRYLSTIYLRSGRHYLSLSYLCMMIGPFLKLNFIISRWNNIIFRKACMSGSPFSSHLLKWI